jgi:hypothetical protein
MRLRSLNTTGRVCALLSFVVLCATALSAPPALALPEGRVYEMVSPPYKAGYSAYALDAVAPDGESAVFISQGTFAGAPAGKNFGGAPYLARRAAAGWSTSSLEAPAAVAPLGSTFDFSTTLQSSLWTGKLGPNEGAATLETNQAVFLRHAVDEPDTVENWPVTGDVVESLEKTRLDTSVEGVSSDLCHVVFNTNAGGYSQLLPSAVGTEADVYEFETGCNGEHALRLVAVKNKDGADGEPEVIYPVCKDYLGGIGPVGNEAEGFGEASKFNDVAAEGSEMFFTAFVNLQNDQGCKIDSTQSLLSVPQVFVRLDGTRTLEVSKPVGEACSEVPCANAASRAPALFWGASEDGSKVFFAASEALVPGDSDGSNNLYMATIGCAGGGQGCEAAEKQVTSLVAVSHGPVVGEAAEVQGVVKIASDGSRVYFVARGVLSAGANAEGDAPVKGADNLYVYDSVTGGPPVFIADLCSEAGRSGLVADYRCPSDLEPSGGGKGRHDQGLWDVEQSGGYGWEHPAQTAGPEGDAGRFLVFASFGKLVKSDTDGARDVYRYDAQTGSLERVSLGEAGSGTNGNCEDTTPTTEVGGMDTCDATLPFYEGFLPPNSGALQRGLATRAVSEDGSRIVFVTAQPLSPAAVNGLINVYEWHKEPGWSEGRVTLISSGSAPEGQRQAVITPSGRDIFFVTGQGLVPQDTDGQADVYDARLGGGFPAASAERQPCSGDACQGPLTNPAPLLVPGSVPQAPGGNFTPAAPASTTKAVPRAKPKKCRKGTVKKGSSKCVRRHSGKAAKGRK